MRHRFPSFIISWDVDLLVEHIRYRRCLIKSIWNLLHNAAKWKINTAKQKPDSPLY